MTREELKKYVRPLVWVEYDNFLFPVGCEVPFGFIQINPDGTWTNCMNMRVYQNLWEAKQPIEERYVQEVTEFFNLDEN